MAWKTKTEQGFLVAETDVAKPFVEDGAILSDVIVGDIGGSKIPVGFNITVAGTNQTTPFQIEMSFDGTNWTGATELLDNATLNSTGVIAREADLTDKHAPYWRLKLVPGDDAGEVGRVKFIYTRPPIRN